MGPYRTIVRHQCTTIVSQGQHPPLWTVGHSSRSLEEFVRVVQAHGIGRIVDVRAYPQSRRHPQFARESLAAALPRAGLGYLWRGKALGGFRGEPAADTPHVALAGGFAAYAEHTASAEFRSALAEILDNGHTALMCAERDWRSCHRFLIADYAAAVLGVTVRHIIDAQRVEDHVLHEALRVVDGGLRYDRPGGQGLLF